MKKQLNGERRSEVGSRKGGIRSVLGPLLSVLLLLAFCAPLFAAAPVFLGSTTDYITNSGGTITFVHSNRIRVIYGRGNSQSWITNGVIGNSLWQIHGQRDTNGSVLNDYAFGDRGSVWQEVLTTNQVGVAETSSGTYVWLFKKQTGVLQFAGTGGIKVESASVNFTNLPGSGAFVAISPLGALYRTNEVITTNYDGLTVTNGTASVIATATRFGGALTNISLNAQGPAVIHVDGSTNVNIVAMMNWVAGLQRSVVLLITNRTATPRPVSLGATTNQWSGLGSITAPWQNTNALWISCENLGTSNVVYAAQYVANPSN